MSVSSIFPLAWPSLDLPLIDGCRCCARLLACDAPQPTTSQLQSHIGGSGPIFVFVKTQALPFGLSHHHQDHAAADSSFGEASSSSTAAPIHTPQSSSSGDGACVRRDVPGVARDRPSAHDRPAVVGGGQPTISGRYQPAGVGRGPPARIGRNPAARTGRNPAARIRRDRFAIITPGRPSIFPSPRSSR